MNETRSAIVAAAGELTFAHGPSGFSADDLARRAGTSRRTIFNHFASLTDAVDEYLGNVLATPIKNISNAPMCTPDELLKVARTQLLSEETFETVRLLTNTLAPTDPRDQTQAWRARIAERAVTLLTAELTRVEGWDDIDCEIFARTLVSTLESASIMWSRSETADRASWTAITQRCLRPLTSFSSTTGTER